MSRAQSFVDKVGANLFAAINSVETVESPLDVDSGAAIVIALSGGPDSTSLILALHMVAQQLGLKMHACHINHGLRGRESDKDEQFCRELCKNLNIPLRVCKLDKRDDGFDASEESLRDARYEQLAHVAREIESKFVVLGHTSDDQAETTLFRLFRGSSLKGLEAMRPVRRHGELFLLRPMLNIRRAECLAYLKDANVSARSDKSNDDTKYSRNYIRAELIPRIEDRFPGFVERAAQFRQILNDENDFWDSICSRLARELAASDSFGSTDLWNGTILRNQPSALLRRFFANALYERGIEPRFDRVQLIFDMLFQEPSDDTKPGSSEGNRVSSRVSLSTLYDIGCTAGGDLIWYCKAAKDGNVPVPDVVLPPSGETNIPNTKLKLAINILEKNAQIPTFPKAHELTALVDLSAFSDGLVFRAKRPNDFIQPFGMTQQVHIRKYLHTHRRQSRTALKSAVELGFQAMLADTASDMVLASGSEVLWVPGVGLSEKVRVRVRPTHEICFELCEETEGTSINVRQ